MKLIAILCLSGATLMVATDEKRMELLPPRSDLRVTFKGLTQAGEKTQRLEIRMLATTEPGMKESLKDIGSFYVVLDPDRETSFWPPEILKVVKGSNPMMQQTASDCVCIYYHNVGNDNRKQTWRLTKDHGPVLEKEEWVESSEIPKSKSL